MTNTAAGHFGAGHGAGLRPGRHAAQNNEASLIGGVVGLAEFLGPGALAGSPFAASGSGSGPTAAPAAMPALAHGDTAPASAAPASAQSEDPASAPSSVDAQPVSTPPSETASSPGVAAHSSAAAPGAGGAPPASAPPAAAPIGAANGGSASGGAAQPQQGKAVEAPVVEPPAAQPFLQPGASFAAFMQGNVSASDHDATAVSHAVTFIESIHNSIVFLGDNIAVANALNIAPVTQLNQFFGFGGQSFGGQSFGGAGPASAQLTNMAVTDNDATAVAVAGTWINHAYDSIIVVGNSIATANATNLSPVTQINKALFDAFDDPSFGSVHETNFLIGDNDSAALAQAGLHLGKAGAAPQSQAPPSPSLDPLFDALPGQLEWGDVLGA